MLASRNTKLAISHTDAERGGGLLRVPTGNPCIPVHRSECGVVSTTCHAIAGTVTTAAVTMTQAATMRGPGCGLDAATEAGPWTRCAHCHRS